MAEFVTYPADWDGRVYPCVPYVYVKQNWTDQWMWVPWLWPQTVSDQTAPGVGSAKFEWRFGVLAQPGDVADYWPFMTIGGWFVKIDAADPWGVAPLWIGVIEADTVRPWGTLDYPSGIQFLTAYQLSHLLDHRAIRGSVCNINGDPVHTDARLNFNRKNSYGPGYNGNRSAVKNLAGSYVFETLPASGQAPADMPKWTARDVCEYILVYFASWHPDAVSSGITWRLGGACDALDAIVEEWNLAGLSPWQALKKLITRRRGFGFRLVTDGETDVVVEVFTLFSEPIDLGTGEIVPANDGAVVIDVTDPIHTPVIQIADTAFYDQVIVEGNPLTVCSTFAAPSGLGLFAETLVAGWTAAEESAYNAVTGTTEERDLARTADAYQRVWNELLVDGAWDWTYNGVKCNPTVLDDGTLDFSTASPQQGKRSFLRSLPIEETAADCVYPEMRKPFVLVYLYDGGGGVGWYYVNQVGIYQKKEGNLEMLSNALGIGVRTQIPHVAGSDDFTDAENSDIEADYSWRDYLLTAAYHLDTTLKVKVTVAGRTLNSMGRTKLLRDDEAECWIVMPGTVLDVDPAEDNGLSVYAGAAEVRNDRIQLLKKANLAAAMYSQQRASFGGTWKGIDVRLPVGTLVDGIVDSAGYTCVGTVVTHRTWDFEFAQTALVTSYEDLD